MTVRADCAVSACNPLLPPIKALAPWLSVVGSRPLDRGLPSPHPVASSQNKANFPFHQPYLFTGFWAVSGRIPLSVMVFGVQCGSAALWLHLAPGVSRVKPWPWQRSRMIVTDQLLTAHGPREGDLGDILAASKAICFEDPLCFSPAWHWLPTYASPWWKGKMHLDELTGSKTESVHRRAPSKLLRTKCYLGILPVGSDVCLPLLFPQTQL